jgi:hypothetical protein
MAKKRKKAARRRPRPVEVLIATEQETAAFFRRLRHKFPKKPRTKHEKQQLRTYLAHFIKEELRGFMRSALISMVRHQRVPRPPKARGRARRRRGHQRR